MQARHANGIRFYQFSSIAADSVSHGVFTRHGGVSPAPFASLNMSTSTGDTPENVRENRLRAFSALERAPDSVADVWQVHGAEVVLARSPNAPGTAQGRADALITDSPAVTLCLRFADCVPIVLYDRRRPALGVVHAGWRGTLLGAAAATVRAMGDAFGTRPPDIVAGIGPSIGPCHYAVGPVVVERAWAAFGDVAGEVLARRNGAVHFDLWAANRHALLAAGVEQIETADICTACRTDEFFSYRGERPRTGCFAAIAGLR
jgi:polyphenol oxidase